MSDQNSMKELSLKEKVSLCEGRGFWTTRDFPEFGIPSIRLSDGPHGIRLQEDQVDMLGLNASAAACCFPAEVNMGSSWDTELAEEIGKAIGIEAAARDVQVVLGPGANVKRHPLAGRNFEYFSEDPLLSGKLAAAMVRGIQNNGTAACVKHFACNNQETSRFNSSSILDERTLREIYLRSFETAVKEGKPAAVMAAYNKINGIHASDNQWLLDDILRKEWGFNGLVVTDWGGMNNRISAFKAGCDLMMPGGSHYMEQDVIQAVKNGSLQEQYIDQSVQRILNLAERTKHQKPGKDDPDYMHNLARRAAVESAVLLKNEDQTLPLKNLSRTLITGSMAQKPRYQGAGSSHLHPYRISSAVESLKECPFVPGCDEQGNTTSAMLEEVKKAALQAETVVVFAGLPERFESEGYDRDSMQLPQGHLDLIETVLQACTNVIVVLSSGSPVECPWAGKVKGILYMGLAGEASGEAAAALLKGEASPSGRLAETWPKRHTDCPALYKPLEKDAVYTEGIYTGYRFYDKAVVEVQWPFGYGLSYTNFEYSHLSVKNGTVSVKVKNTGITAGGEVVQVYLHHEPDAQYRARRELAAFQKVYLEPGESRTLELPLDEACFQVWKDGWKYLRENAEIQTADLKAPLYIPGEAVNLHTGSWKDGLDPAELKEQVLSRRSRRHKGKPAVKGHFTMDNTIEEMKQSSWLMSLMDKAVLMVIHTMNREDPTINNPHYLLMRISTLEAPLRTMMMCSQMPEGLFTGLLEMANGHYVRGMGTMIRGLLKHS